MVKKDIEVSLLKKGIEDIQRSLRFHIKNMFATKFTTDQDQQLFIESISKTIDDEWFQQSNSKENKD